MKKWVIQNVYRPEENIDFLEEWIQHHIDIGCSHFYLYDNTGSCHNDTGYELYSHGKNRHGFDIDLNRDFVKLQDQIFSKFNGYITKIDWRPIYDGKPTYDNIGAANHCSDYLKDQNVWCAFIDMDEFITEVPLEFLDRCEKNGISQIRMTQIKYKHRCLSETKKVKDINEYIDIDTTHWAEKLLINMSKYIKVNNINNTNIHRLRSSENEIRALIFKHYSHGEFSHNWLINNYHQFNSNLADWVKKHKDFKTCFVSERH